MSGHLHHADTSVGTKLRFAVFLSGLILVAELIGGFWANSLALLSDAGHLFVDVLALSLSWYGVRQAERPSTSRMTFGYHRIGVIVAIVNAISIFAIATVIIYEAYNRLQDTPEVNSPLMLTVAVVGLAVNALVALWLRREQRTNLNVRSAFWHALGDALASIGVILAAIIMLITDWFWADPVISIVIAVVIVMAGWRILKEGLRVILEAVPGHLDIAEMIAGLSNISGVDLLLPKAKNTIRLILSFPTDCSRSSKRGSDRKSSSTLSKPRSAALIACDHREFMILF